MNVGDTNIKWIEIMKLFISKIWISHAKGQEELIFPLAFSHIKRILMFLMNMHINSFHLCVHV
jgi:hypothetical protein